MSDTIYFKRQNRLKEVLGDKGLDGMLITNLTNIRYICGCTGSAASCLVTPGGQYFITDGRYIEQSKSQVKGFERYIDMSSHFNQIKENKLNVEILGRGIAWLDTGTFESLQDASFFIKTLVKIIIGLIG